MSSLIEQQQPTIADLLAIGQQLQRIEMLVRVGAKDVLTLQECAAYTGLAVNTLYRLTSQREIPFHRPPNRGNVYFSKAEINDWLLRGRKPTNAETQSAAATYCATNKRGRRGKRTKVETEPKSLAS